MIQKLKQQSSSFHALLAFLLSLTIAGLFLYATFIQRHFFIYIAAVFLVGTAILVFLHFLFLKRQAALRVQKQDWLEKNNLLEAEIQKGNEFIQSLHKKIFNYSRLKDVVEKLSLSLTLAETSQTLCQQVHRLFGRPEGVIILYLLHSQTGELELLASFEGDKSVQLKAKKGDIFDQWVMKTLQPLIVENTKKDFRFDVDRITTEDQRTIRTLISVPLLIGNKAVGILRVDSPRENIFTMEDVRLLVTIGDVGAIAMENAQLYERVQDLAIRDGLTGLFLRWYLLERMSQEMSRELRNNKELSFLIIDLDKFKKYNDTFGHMAGDIVLKAVARILVDYFKEPGDLVCRYGGEEFAVLLPDCPKGKALRLAEEIRKGIEAQTILLRREKTSVTVSIGVAAFPRDAKLKEEVIFKADEAMYKAKEKGRNRVCVA